jgi:hypothetical protein
MKGPYGQSSVIVLKRYRSRTLLRIRYTFIGNVKGSVAPASSSWISPGLLKSDVAECASECLKDAESAGISDPAGTSEFAGVLVSRKARECPGALESGKARECSGALESEIAREFAGALDSEKASELSIFSE